MINLSLKVNGETRSVEVEPRTTLLELLREMLLLTGTKEACGIGECGNCMILMDDEPVPSCLVLAVDADGRSIVTVEGLAPDGQLDEVQAAFHESGAFQCGFCTPGMVITTKALLQAHPDAGPEHVKQALSGVLCRCGSYTRILKAIDTLTGRSGR